MRDQTTLSELQASRSRGSDYWTDIVFGRTLPATFFGIFVVYKLMLTGSATARIMDHQHATSADYTAFLSQALGLAYYCLLATLYVVRLPKRAGDARPAVILVSFFGSFSILALGVLPNRPPDPSLYPISQVVIVAGLAYTLYALAYLRRSFSILPEARRLVTGGPYRISRHPVYLGEGLAAVGLALPIASWAGWLLIACFLGAQVTRTYFEEAVLARQFPVEHAEYRRRVPRFLPFPRPRR
jgi:protein-S-isoprenylcysteine O-methyltransferase Ste14